MDTTTSDYNFIYALGLICLMSIMTEEPSREIPKSIDAEFVEWIVDDQQIL